MVFWVGRVLDSPLEGKGDALQFVIVILVFDETTRSDDVETASCLCHFSLPLNWICVTVLYLFSVLITGKIPIFPYFQSKATEKKAILIDFLFLAFKEDGDFDVLFDARLIFWWH